MKRLKKATKMYSLNLELHKVVPLYIFTIRNL